MFWLAKSTIPKITGSYFCTSLALDKQRFQRSSPDCCILCKVGEKRWRFVICPHSQWLQSTDLHSGPQTEASEVAKKLRYCWIKLLLPLGMLSILFQFSRHFIYDSCGSQECYSQKDFFFRSSITSGNSERDKSKYRSRLCAVLAALHTLHSWLPWRRGDRDGSMEPLFVPLCPSMQVSPSDGEGSGKHLYLKSTLSTVPLSERS